MYVSMNNHDLLISEKYEAQIIIDALRIVRLKLLKCAGIALFTVTSFFAPLAFVTDYAIQVIRI